MRDRFARKLRVCRQHHYLNPDRPIVSDQMALRLVDGLQISQNAQWHLAEVAYAALPHSPGEPLDLATLRLSGRVRLVWGRAEICQEVRSAALRAPAGTLDALKTLVKTIHDEHYDFTPEVRTDRSLDQLVTDIDSKTLNPGHIIVQTPPWIVARLWEAALGRATPDDALRRWTDLWRVLQRPAFIPAAVWAPADAETFREAVFRAVASEPGLGGWTATRDLYVQEIAAAHGVMVAEAGSRVPPPPPTLVERALWTEAPMVEGCAYGSLDAADDLFGLMRLIVAEIDDADQTPAPHPLAARLIDLACDRAELFIALLFQVRARPRLLADLAIHPPSAALACLLIAQWQPIPGAWDRRLAERDFQLDQAAAFADAVAMLGMHLSAGTIASAEAAALLTWLHSRARRGFIDDVNGSEPLLVALRLELATLSSAALTAMVAALDGSELREGLGTAAFAAAISLIDIGGIEDGVAADVLIDAYADAITAGAYSLTAHRIGVAEASALARVAARSPALRTRFLAPLDVRARLAAAVPDHNPYTLADELGRGLRAHIRILCRAIIGDSAEASDDIFGALLVTVKTGALAHKEKGRVAAFTPSFESALASSPDRPLAVDLAAALAVITPSRQKALLAAVLETDEPLVLAQLLVRSPPHLRGDIEERIAALAPNDAGAILSLTDMQARITELLNAGAADAAENYMTAELSLKTLGPSPGRDLVRFQNRLRLAFLKEDWTAITQTPEPQFPAPLDQAAALEILQQFRGLAALKSPASNASAAKTMFATLFAKGPTLATATNWFAASISELLTDSFELLSGARLREGQNALAEVDRMVGQLNDGPSDEVLECNRALLLLALGEPGQALAVLSAVDLIRLQDVAAAYRAIALARLGRRTEATAALDHAEHTVGRTPVVTAARAHIANGASFLAVPDVSVLDDLNTNIGSAIARFRSLNPTDQARALNPMADAFEALMVEQVRAAAGAVVSLVPMMKDTTIDTNEDDLSAFIQHILAARVHFLNWSVGDQSKGGFSAKGNAGERDLLVTWGGSILTLIEAVVCEKALTQDVMKADLESHFQKLLGYGNPRIFFHLTYAYGQDLVDLVRFLEGVAETASPPGFAYLGRDPIPHEDSRPPGFIARYMADFGEVRVVFLVLNMGQVRQRQAAKTAGATKSRKAPKKPQAKLPTSD
ncbi:MAG: hypothetical protein ACYDD1_01555 [Caulobacteraceae bacterium]